MKDVLEKLESHGVKRLKFYYKKSRIIGNICTVCLLLEENNTILSRGIAICSLHDSHKKTTGKNIALGRAIKALINKSTSEAINSDRDSLMFNSQNINININTKSPYLDIIKKEATEQFFRMKTINKNKDEKILQIEVPLDFPLYETQKLFKSKSEFMPIPTDEEKRIIERKII